MYCEIESEDTFEAVQIDKEGNYEYFSGTGDSDWHFESFNDVSLNLDPTESEVRSAIGKGTGDKAQLSNIIVEHDNGQSAFQIGDESWEESKEYKE